MPQALVSGSVALQQNSSVLPVPLVASKGPYTFLRCTTRRLTSRQCRTCGAYQQKVEETIRRKAPSTPPGPDTTRRPPPPPPPPPPSPPSGQVEPDAVAELVCNFAPPTPQQLYGTCSSRVRLAELYLLCLAYAQ